MLKMAKTIWLSILLLAAALSAALADHIELRKPVRSAAQDEVKGLPALADDINFKHYSGYLEADNVANKFLHYWMVESQSSPGTDPLVLWLNGEPGCSSLLGLMAGVGPFRVDDLNEGLVTNPYAWNRFANVIFLESPAGVGFSYALDGVTAADDDTTADQNYMALKSFLRKFPQFAIRPLYLVGESYSAVHALMLAARLDKDPAVNLKGVALGNGQLDASKLSESLVYFNYLHGLVGSSIWRGLSQHCCGGKAVARQNCNFMDAHRSLACGQLVVRATEDVLNSGVNPDNLAAWCDNPLQDGPSTGGSHERAALLPSARKYKPGKRCTRNFEVLNYLNWEEVKDALHIPRGLPFFNGCTKIDYTMIYPYQKDGLAPQMRQLIDSPHQPTLLVYSGDASLRGNFHGNQWFVEDLNRTLVKDLTPWNRENQISGWITHYDRVTLLTLKGAGSSVGLDRPKEALYVLKALLGGAKP